jgi:hypothetical protein
MKSLSVLCVVALLASAGLARADSFMNVNFDTAAVGDAVPTSSLSTTVQAIGGYDSSSGPAWDPGYQSPPTASCGTITVADVAGMSKAALLSTTAGNTQMGALWMDTAYSEKAQVLDQTFNVAILQNASSMTVQPKNLIGTHLPTTAGIVFGINNFVNGGSAHGLMFAAAATSAEGGVFGVRSADNSSLQVFGTYVEGETYQIELISNYTTGTADAYLNGVKVLSDYNFWNAGASDVTTGETFFFVNGDGAGQTSTQVALDNITGSGSDSFLGPQTSPPVPEPITMAGLLLGVGALGRYWSRKRRVA